MGWSDVPLPHLILLPVIWFSTLLYFYLVVLILASRSTKSLFRTPFFSIVLAQAFWDLSMFSCAFFVVFCRKFCLIPYPEGDNILIARVIYFTQTLLPCCMYFNCLLYAASRLSAFYFPMSLDELWRPRNIVICMIFTAFVGGIIVGSMFLDSTSIYLKRLPGGRMMMGADGKLIERTCLQDLALSLASCLICCVVYVHLAARKSAAMAKYQRTFFRCAVTVFVPYIPNAIKSFLLFYASYSGKEYLAFLCVESWLYVIYLMCLTPPWALLLTCPTLRSRAILTPELTLSRPVSKLIPTVKIR